MRRGFAVLIMLLSGLLAPTGFAAQPEATIAAERLFREGQELFDRGRVDDACEKLEQSLDIDWAIGTLLNLARCHAAQGKTATAWREYRHGAAAAAEVGQTERAEGAREIARQLEHKLSRLTISAPQPRGLIVRVGGRRLEERELDRAEPIDPGSYEITAEAPGYQPWSTTIAVKPDGDDVIVKIGPLEPLPSAPSQAPEPAARDAAGDDHGLRTAGFAIGGVGAATLIAAAVLGGLTIRDTNRAENDPSLCPDKVCTPAGRERIDAAETKGIAATALFVLGGAALAAGAVLIGLDAADDDDVAVAPALGADGGGLVIGGHF